MPQRIQQVGFIGAGSMGAFNSLLAAAAGVRAVVYDRSSEALERFPARQRQLAEYCVGQRMLEQSAAEGALKAVRLVDDCRQAARDADLISESVSEHLDLKREVLRQFEDLAPERAILTTNASNLLPSELDDALFRGERFAALHSHLGAWLFDIAGGPRANEETLATLEAYVRQIGGTPLVHVKERRGYLANTLFGAVNSTALSLAANERGTPEDIDRAWMSFQKAPAGPFGMMDFVGLDVVLDVTEAAANRRGATADSRRVLAMLHELVDAGKLGVKSGEGIYRYPNPAFTGPEFLKPPAQRQLYVPLIRRLLTAALLLVARGYATADSVDVTWRLTSKSPVGPFELLKSHWTDILLDEFSIHWDEGPGDGLMDTVREMLKKHL